MATTVNVNIKATNKASRPINKAGREIERLGQRASRAGKEAKADWGGLGDLFSGLLPRGLQSTIRSFKSTQRQIGRLSKSFKVLKGAIAATGLGLLVVVLGEIIANWETITEFFSDTTREDQLKKETKLLEDQNTKLSAQLTLQKAMGATAGELYKTREDILKVEARLLEKEIERLRLDNEKTSAQRVQVDLEKKELELLALQVTEERRRSDILNEARATTDETYSAELKRQKVVEKEMELMADLEREAQTHRSNAEIHEERIQQYKGTDVEGTEFYNQQIAWRNEEQEKLTGILADQEVLQTAINKKLDEYDNAAKRREREARLERERKERIANEQFIADQILRINRDMELRQLDDAEAVEKRRREMAYEDAQTAFKERGASDEELKILKEQYEQDITDIEKKFATQRSDNAARLDDELELLRMDDFDREERALMEAYDRRVALAGDDEGLILQATEQFLKDKAALEERYAQDGLRKQHEDQMDRLSLQQRTAEQGLSVLTDINTAFSKRQDQDSKRQFQRTQALAVAETLVSTYFAAQLAYKSQMTPPTDPSAPIRATLAAASAVASGLARVAAIKSQKYNQGSSGGASGGGMRGGFSGPQPQGGAPGLPQRLVNPEAMRAYVVQTDLQGQAQAASKMQAQTVL